MYQSKKTQYELKYDKLCKIKEHKEKKYPYCKNVHKNYKIINDIYYSQMDYDFGCGIKMYNENMVWMNGFEPIAPYLVLNPESIVAPTCDIGTPPLPDSPSRLAGKPFPDTITGSTFILFKTDGKGPITNVPSEEAILMHTYLNTVDYVFTYHAVPEDPDKPIKISFYSKTDMYGFNEGRFWYMLDNTSHFTTYTKLSHTFTIRGVLNWIVIVENIMAIYLIVKAILPIMQPILNICEECINPENTCTTFLTTNIKIHRCCEGICDNAIRCPYSIRESILIGKVEVLQENISIIFEPDLIYSVNRMRNYIYNNSKSLLLPIIPVGIDPVYTNIQPYYNVGDSAIWSDTSDLIDSDRTDWYGSTYYGINVSELSKAGDILVEWEITYTITVDLFDAPSIILLYQWGGLWYTLDRMLGNNRIKKGAVVKYDRIPPYTTQVLIATNEEFPLPPPDNTQYRNGVILPNDTTDVIFYINHTYLVYSTAVFNNVTISVI